MEREVSFVFPLVNGLHARPASHLQAVARRFASDVILRVEAKGERAAREANAKSVLSLVGADVQAGDGCVLVVSGADEETCAGELAGFVRDVLPTTDDVAAVAAVRGEAQIPRSLRAAGLGRHYRGTGIGGGSAVGSAVVAGRGGISARQNGVGRAAASPDAEIARYQVAATAVERQLAAEMRVARRRPEREVLAAHLAILEDVELGGRVMRLTRERGLAAPAAVMEAAEHFSGVLRGASSAYLRERAADVQDVCGRVLESMGEGNSGQAEITMTGPSIVVAESLTPSQFLKLDRNHLRGLVLRDGGTTAHTLILARSFGVPAIVGVEEAPGGFVAGERVALDAGLGIVVPSAGEGVERYYALEAEREARIRLAGTAARRLPARTVDGQVLEVGCNVASAEEVAPGIEAGADGVGLFRTEMIFLGREAAPSEAEQVEIYSRAARDAGDAGVVIRLIDIGGDKPATYLNLVHEENPYLGCRGVRLYLELRELVRGQVRAALVAGAQGRVRLLVPMVSCVEEVRLAREIVAEAVAELGAEGKTLAAVPELGVMIEVPSAAMIVTELAREADFFSVGSNDLTQYFLAADRGNARLASLYTWRHPAFLRLLKRVVDDARAAGKWVGLCGEMGEDPAALPVLIGLGLDEISVSGPNVAATKAAVRSSDGAACGAQLSALVACSTRAEVEGVLAKGRATGSAGMGGASMLDEAAILFDVDARSKEEAIKVLCDALAVAGRTEVPALVEEAVWKREETYSTGFGHGLAVPHCKSEHVRAGSIAIAKLAKPVAWGSIDGEPVDVVILLAIKSGPVVAGTGGVEREHMKVFSQLSRSVMRDEFREQLRAAPDPASLKRFLEQSLGLSADITGVSPS